MDSIVSWAKENFDLITLFVGLIGVVVSVVSVIYEIKKKKAQKRRSSTQKAFNS